MPNPVVEARMQLGLTRPELARGSGVAYDAAYRTEVGLVNAPHRRIVQFLVAAGFAREDLLKRYADYRQSAADDLRRRAMSQKVHEM
ncbi:MAG: hypothetical protein Q8P50_14965 [Bacillota bacterium]|nr:hypothetical protein [Bacillota bacterium]